MRSGAVVCGGDGGGWWRCNYDNAAPFAAAPFAS
jgi:hypothetical protein